MLSDPAETLWGQVTTSYGHLMHEIDLLNQQFHGFLTDPARTAGTTKERFEYKVNVNYWYRYSIRRTKAKLQQQLASYWTTEKAGIDWMQFYEKDRLSLDAKRLAVVERRMGNFEWLLKKTEDTLVLKFTDMRQMVMLNPVGNGAEGDRLFDDDGPLIRGDGDTMSWMDFKAGSV